MNNFIMYSSMLKDPWNYSYTRIINLYICDIYYYHCIIFIIFVVKFFVNISTTYLVTCRLRYPIITSYGARSTFFGSKRCFMYLFPDGVARLCFFGKTFLRRFPRAAVLASESPKNLLGRAGTTVKRSRNDPRYKTIRIRLDIASATARIIVTVSR